jgi:hypothetical protein
MPFPNQKPMKPLFLFLILMPLISVCQAPESPKAKKVSVGLIFSPDYCYRTLKSDELSKLTADFRDTIEIHKFGYTTGLSLVYKFNNRIRFESGLLFSDKGEKTKPWTLNAFDSGVVVPVKSEFSYGYNYLDIPFKVNYLVRDKKLKLFITGGLSANIFLSLKTTSIVEFEDGTTESYTSTGSGQGFDRINLAFLVGFAAEYELSKHLGLHIEPVYRRSITSVISSSLKDYLFSAGINTGVYYKF